MNWQIAKVKDATTCGACGVVIGKGEPYATVTAANLPRCEACMKRLFEMDPPNEVWAVKPPTDVVPEIARGFTWATARGLSSTVGAAARDGRLEQMPRGDR